MRSLVQKTYWLAIPLFGIALSALIPTAVVAGVSNANLDLSLLEDPRVSPVGDRGEIRIQFSTPVRYIRHFPESKGNQLRIFLEINDPCVAEKIQTQESRWLPKKDWYVPFTVSFPELINRPGTGAVVCAESKNKVDVAETLLVKFERETEYKVRMGDDNRSIIVSVPKLTNSKDSKLAQEAKPVPAVKAEPETKVAPSAQQDAKAVQLPGTPDVAVAAKPVERPSASLVKALPTMPANELMDASRAALASGDAIKATMLLNQLLDLPPNSFSQEAQELIGVAREKSGELEKAKVENELYLKLYPDGDGAGRVKQRLAQIKVALDTPKPTKENPKPKKAIKQINQNTVTGSVSQYYYGGRSTSYTQVADDPRETARSTDQSSLITNVDVTARFRHNQYDTKVVIRDTETENALANRFARNTLSAAYVEHENKDVGFMFRAGRQSGTAQGVLGRFDGVFGRYALNDKWRVTAVVGQPDYGSHNNVTTSRHFYGAGVEFGPLADKWSGSFYGIESVADGFSERRAIGSELRYFSGTTSWFGMGEYDVLYHGLNLAMLQGNWVAFGDYNFNFLADHRKSPILYGDTILQLGSLTNAADSSVIQQLSRIADFGQLRNEYNRLSSLFPATGNRISKDDFYSYVKDITAESDMLMLGVSRQVTQRWQLGADARVNRTTSTHGLFIPGVTSGASPPDVTNDIDIPSQPRSGYIYGYTLQAIGNSVIFKEDSTSLMINWINDPYYNAENYSFSNSVSLREKLRIDTSLGYYDELRKNGVKTWRVTPSVRLNYRVKDNLSFEAQYTVDKNKTEDPTTLTQSGGIRQSLFMGYRWDYR